MSKKTEEILLSFLLRVHIWTKNTSNSVSRCSVDNPFVYL